MTTPETPHTPALSFGLPLPICKVRVRFAKDGAVVDLPEDTRVKPCVDANLVPLPMLALFRRQTVLIERTPGAWEWGTVEGWDEECRRLRAEVSRLREQATSSPPRPPPSITPGTLVSFQAGDHVCVGYVDSLDPVAAGFAANVTACKVQPGRWAREKNPSLDGALQSWRVPLGDLTPLPSPDIDPRPLGPRLRRKPR